jgi:cysteine desulfurase
MSEETYFDYAAGAPPAVEALRRFNELTLLFGNPSSAHEHGRHAAEALAAARKGVLAQLGDPEADFVLTSGATEANNLAIRGVMEANPDGRLLLAPDVHESAWFAKDLYGKRVDLLETGPSGRLDPAAVEAKLTRKTVLVSILHANHETGVVHDVPSIGAACARKGVALHVDGVQAVGRLPLRLADLPFAFYTFSAHKFGGLRGTGGAVVRAAKFRPQISGGGQEKGARSGTENVAGLGAALAALGVATAAQLLEVPRLRGFAKLLVAGVPGALLNSDLDHGVPGLVSLSFPGLVGENLVAELDQRGFAVSAGSACGSGKMQPSRPVMAMGRTREQALGTVRISMGRSTTEEAVRRLAATLSDVARRQRALA